MAETYSTGHVSSAVAAAIQLHFPSYILDIRKLCVAKIGLRYNHFDCSVINGTESRNTLPVLNGYIAILGKVWELLREYETLVDRDVRDIEEKAQNFITLDHVLSRS